MYIGSLDIGGTKTIAAILDTRGKIVDKMLFPTRREDWAAHFADCCAALAALRARAGLAGEAFLGYGVNMPGMVDNRRGVLLRAPFANWEDVPVREFFRDRLGSGRVFVENDVKSCALGEKHFGFCDTFKSFVWITISTGIGAAIVEDGRVLRGADNLAGELGHVKVEYAAGRTCSCGAAGCLEAYASGTAITREVERAAREDAAFGRRLAQAGLPRDAKGCAALADAGDARALGIYETAADYLARGIACVINLINPQAVILGGGVADSLHLLLPGVRRQCRRYVIKQAAKTEIVRTRLGYEAALIGTAALVLEGVGAREAARVS